jgi:hypothetical protein
VSSLDGSDGLNGREDFFVTLPAAGVPTDVPAASRKAILREPRVITAVVLMIAIVGAVCFWSLRSKPLPALPISDPPPNGGSLVVPPTIGGAPTMGPMDARSVPGTFPQYAVSDVLFQYYDGRATDHSLISAIALRGPADDLPDPSTMTDFSSEWTLHESALCSPWYLRWTGPDRPEDIPADPVKSDGYVCWRSTGSFSASLLVMRASADEAAAMLDEFWMSQ